MYLQNLIKERLLSSEFHIINKLQQPITQIDILNQYSSIKNYLIHNDPSAVAIKIEKDYPYVLIMLACLELGITYIPMKSDYPDDRVTQIKEDSKFSLLIDQNNLESILHFKQEIKPYSKKISENDVAYILFTSGTTGRPKGVEIQRSAMANFFQFIGSEFKNINSSDNLLQVTEFTFDISLVDIAVFLIKNTPLHFSNFNNNILKLAYEIETLKINFLNTVPNNVNMLLSELVVEKTNFQSLKYIFVGGSRFSWGLYKKCQNYLKNALIYNFYGPTEATIYCHYKSLNFNEESDSVEHNISIGKPISNVDAMIWVNDKVASPNERGELLIGGIQLMKDYINNPEQSKKVICSINGKRFYKSGDIAFMDTKGEYYIVGRLDDTIKYRGFRINLLDIDSYIHKIPYIHDSTTIAIENEETDNITVCFMIMNEAKTVKEIKKDLSVYLLDYQIPEKIIFVDKFPVNTSGKVDRKLLKSEYLAKV